jgi:hypothetical protein
MATIAGIAFDAHQGTVAIPAAAGATVRGCDGSTGVLLESFTSPRRSVLTLYRLQDADTPCGLEAAQGVQDVAIGAYAGRALVTEVSERRLAVQVGALVRWQVVVQVTVEALP